MKVYELMSLLGKIGANKDVIISFTMSRGDLDKFDITPENSLCALLDAYSIDVESGVIYADFKV